MRISYGTRDQCMLGVEKGGAPYQYAYHHSFPKVQLLGILLTEMLVKKLNPLGHAFVSVERISKNFHISAVTEPKRPPAIMKAVNSQLD